jgi:hypothetical protein
MGNKPSIILSDNSRMAGPAPFIRNETRFFPQNTKIDLLCGQYALNHILQEEKIVWRPDQPLLIGGDDPLTPGVQINYWAICNEHYANLRAILGDNLGQAQGNLMSRCAMGPGEKPGMFPVDSFARVLDMLNLRNETELGTRRNQDKANMRRVLTRGFNAPNFLGVLFTDSTHYIAIAKYTNACRGGYARIDSRFCMKDGAECLSKNAAIDSAMEYMDDNGGAVLIYADRAESYPSVAVQRMRAYVENNSDRNAAEKRRAAERNAATIAAASARNAETIAAASQSEDERKARAKAHFQYGEPSAPWIIRYHPEFKRVFYSNTDTLESTWNFRDTMTKEEIKLEEAVIASAAKPPHPWEKKYHIAQQMVYYFNPITKKSVSTIDEIETAGGRRIRKTRRSRRSRNSTRARK